MSEDRTENSQVSEDTHESNEPKVAARSKKPSGATKTIAIAIVLIAVLVAILHFTGVLKLGGEGVEGTEAPVQTGDAVARINGEEVPRAELTKRLEQIKATIPEGSPDPTADAAFELQILDELINLALLKQLAVKEGYTATDEAVAAEIAEVTEVFGSEEALNQQLQVVGLSREEFTNNVRNELLIRQLVEANTDIENIEISDEEVQTAYDEAFAEAEDAPSLDEARDFIKDQLTQQETNAMIQTYLEQVRAQANIEVLL